MGRYIGIGAVLLGVMAGIVACARPSSAVGAAATAPSVQDVTIRSTDQFRFEPSTITVHANTPVRLTLDNSGSALVHDFTIDNLGGQKVSIVAQPRSKATGEFTPHAAGTYPFYCSQPGHKEAGMVGTLTVTS